MGNNATKCLSVGECCSAADRWSRFACRCLAFADFKRCANSETSMLQSIKIGLCSAVCHERIRGSRGRVAFSWCKQQRARSPGVETNVSVLQACRQTPVLDISPSWQWLQTTLLPLPHNLLESSYRWEEKTCWSITTTTNVLVCVYVSMNRTARGDNSGTALSFVTVKELPLLEAVSQTLSQDCCKCSLVIVLFYHVFVFSATLTDFNPVIATNIWQGHYEKKTLRTQVLLVTNAIEWE